MQPTLTDLSVREIMDRLATRDPIPGGGSAAALAGSMAAALVGMVVELTTGRPAAAAHEDELAEIAEVAAGLRSELLDLTQADADAYDAVVTARRLPRDGDDERAARESAMTDATRRATIAPLRTARAAASVLELARRLAPIGNANAISDVGVAALLAGSAVHGAGLNVRINLPYLPDGDPLVTEARDEIGRLSDDAARLEVTVREAVEARLG